MKPLWRNHHLHHYKDEGKGFGVSSTLWDHVFGTMFDLYREKEDTAKVRELMFDKKAEKVEKPKAAVAPKPKTAPRPIKAIKPAKKAAKPARKR